ncbi:hypothetical protein CKAH01_15479 [Colletotrichum kahawae]|uniref:Uncharacterized protein n=1 Tax=Colletotrichum kahawae TaxID=34407 RepID=A0AAE0DAE2_COLKA|nr:hypothetical protein CKAH01_15479 [Colletotrichum kahawae]
MHRRRRRNAILPQSTHHHPSARGLGSLPSRPFPTMAPPWPSCFSYALSPIFPRLLRQKAQTRAPVPRPPPPRPAGERGLGSRLVVVLLNGWFL